MLALIIGAAAVFSAPVPAMNYDWFSGVYDWPNKGVMENEPTIVSVDVTVNPYGYMQGCTAYVRRGLPELGPYVCSRLGARAEFDPARDPAGHRMYGIFRTAIVLWYGDSQRFPKALDTAHFKITKPVGTAAPKDGALTIQFLVDVEGHLSSCSLVPIIGYGLNKRKQEIDPALAAEACTELPLKMHPEAARDRSGRLVPSVQTATVGVQ